MSFLKRDAAELSSWRQIDITKDLLEFLANDEIRCRDAVVQFVRTGKERDALITTGKIEALSELMALIERVPQVPLVEVDDFVDPAARRVG